MSSAERRSGPDFAIGQAKASAREASNFLRPEDDAVIVGFVDLAVRTIEWLPSELSLSWFAMDMITPRTKVLKADFDVGR